MKQNIIYVGLGVDEPQYHGSALDKNTSEVIDIKCRPTLKGLVGQFGKLAQHFAEYSIRVCYEASYVGYCLQRVLTVQGFHCEVAAPTHIPRLRGKAI